ncbi:MAG: glutamate racemase [Desulfobacterales bacterium]|jgi:glutamate racemase|nr:glutamate racemase [Desulfobacterales bacterium]
MIGLIDSGLGGLTVAREIRRLLPNQDLLYFGDTAHMPYGARPAAVIRDYTLRSAEFLLKAGANLLVLAGHTVACVAGPHLEDTFATPVLSVSEATITAAMADSSKNGFGLIATRATVESRFFEETIQKRCDSARVYAVAAPLLVALVEEGWIQKPETHMMVKKHLHPLITRQIDTLILGCNHFSLLQRAFARKAGARIKIVTGIMPLALQVKQIIDASSELNQPADRKGALRVMVSEKTAHYEKTARIFFGGHVVLDVA